MKRSWQILQGMVIILLLVSVTHLSASAQTSVPLNPVDLMLVIDHSCSMFPANRSVAGCDMYGSDPNQQRIIGADYMIARLGLGEPNEGDVRLGVVTFGDKPILVSPLVPIKSNRDILANKISTFQAEKSTQVLPALQMAYDALKSSSQATPARLPVIVMLSDGLPSPIKGQTTDDIEKLVSQHADVPLFVLLLKNPNANSADFESYINFWEKLQDKYTFIFPIQMNNSDQIQAAYQTVFGQLQNNISSKSIPLEKGGKNTFIVGSHVEKIVVMGVRASGKSAGVITITDPNGKKVDAKDPGVVYFRGKDNPLEIYAITSPRLSADTQTSPWTVSANDPMTILIDRSADLRFDFLAPIAKQSGLNHTYQAVDRQFSNNGISIRFRLVDSASKTVGEPQAILLNITNPSGKTIDLPQLSLKPDSSGVYELPIDLPTLFPTISDPSGRYVFKFAAGQAEAGSIDISPRTTAALSLELGMIPGIRSVIPLPIYCRQGQPASLQVVVKDVDPLIQDQLSVRVTANSRTLSLGLDSPGQFSGDITELCQAIIVQTACSSITTASLQVQLVIGLVTASIPPVTRQVDANIIAPACTATPQATMTPLPTPAPTAIPDRDGDGVNDEIDRCPNSPGLPMDGGCIPWNPILGGGGVVLVLGLVGGWVWPWLKTSRISPAPHAYLVAFRDGVKMFDPVAIDRISRKHRRSRLVVGGNPHKADIFVEGLQPTEYLIEWWGGAATLRIPGEKEPYAYFDAIPRSLRTSDPKIILNIGTDLHHLWQSK
jgi:hypothetical protein